MAEGLALAGGQAAAGVYDNPDSPPPADPQAAPHGWVWKRNRGWAAAQRAPKPGVRRAGLPTAAPAPSTSSAGSTGPGDQPSSTAPGPQSEDPAPGWAAGVEDQAADDPGPGPSSSSSSGGKLRFDEVPQQVKDDIAGLAGLVAAPILSLLQAVDPYCGTILASNLEPVVDAALPLICRSERIVRYFTQDTAGDWLLWGKLALALAPVGRAIVEHHVQGTVRVVRDEQTGAVTVERRQPGEQWADGDHLTPRPQPAFAA